MFEKLCLKIVVRFLSIPTTYKCYRKNSSKVRKNKNSETNQVLEGKKERVEMYARPFNIVKDNNAQW